MLRRRLLPVLMLLVFVLPSVGRAATDWFGSLYTGEGAEVRADERVFTLFTVLNAMGYDEARLSRQHPVPKREFHPVRARVRSLLSLNPELRAQAESLFDAHPSPVAEYLRATVQLPSLRGPDAGKDKTQTTLGGQLERLLRAVHTQAKVGELWAQLQPEHRKALLRYVAGLDAPLARARALLRQKESPVVLMVNLLDTENAAWGARDGQGTLLVIGPAGTGAEPGALGEPAVRAYAQAVLSPLVAQRAERSWSAGPALLRDARNRGALESSVGDYATALLGRALSLRAVGASDATYKAAAQHGYPGLKDLGRMFDDPRLVEAWAMDALAKVKP